MLNTVEKSILLIVSDIFQNKNKKINNRRIVSFGYVHFELPVLLQFVFDRESVWFAAFVRLPIL